MGWWHPTEAERWFLTRESYDSLFFTCPVREPVEFFILFFYIGRNSSESAQSNFHWVLPLAPAVLSVQTALSTLRISAEQPNMPALHYLDPGQANQTHPFNPLRATGKFQNSAFFRVPWIIASVLLPQSSQSRASWKGLRERKRMRSIMIASTPSIQR